METNGSVTKMVSGKNGLGGRTARKKENGLKQYLTNLAMNEIDAEHLLLLDALRAYIRYSNNTDEIFQFIMNTC